MSFLSRFLYALLLALLLGASSLSAGLTIGVLVFPEHGHLNPLLSILEETGTRGHSFIVYGPDFFMKTCNNEVRLMASFARCSSLGHYNISQFDENYFQSIVTKSTIESLEEVTQHANNFNAFLAPNLLKRIETDGDKLDVFLVDFGAWAGTAVGDVLGVPSVMVWPLTLQFPLESNPSIPALGSSLSIKMSIKERIGNYFLQRLYLVASSWVTEALYNEIRASVKAPPNAIHDLYYRRMILTPSIFGLDIAQPLCPNVHPVGFLARATRGSELSNTHVPEDWAEWMEGCTGGIVYINMGSVAVLPDAWMMQFAEAAFALMAKHCVVWKLTKRQQASIEASTSAHASRQLRLTTHIPFSPILLLRHRNAKVFVTHCGDTSVYESVYSNVPMVGIALFADQSDMCARIDDAGVGIALNKFTFTSAQLIDAVEKMNNNKQALLKLKKLAAMGEALGGAKKAAQIVENVANNKDLLDMFYCPHTSLPWYLRHDFDMLLIVSLLLFGMILLFCKVVSCICCCGAKGSTTKVKSD